MNRTHHEMSTEACFLIPSRSEFITDTTKKKLDKMCSLKQIKPVEKKKKKKNRKKFHLTFHWANCRAVTVLPLQPPAVRNTSELDDEINTFFRLWKQVENCGGWKPGLTGQGARSSVAYWRRAHDRRWLDIHLWQDGIRLGGGVTRPTDCSVFTTTFLTH